MCGDLPEDLQGGVGLQRLRDVLGALITDAVECHTASESQKDTSRGIDSWGRMRGSVLERLQGGVGLQRLRNMLGALSTDPVGPDTASESQKDTSGGADTWEKGVRRRTRAM